MRAARRPASPTEWQRLDPRMLLVHPIRELVRFLPALVAPARRRYGVRRPAVAAARRRGADRARGPALPHDPLPDRRRPRRAAPRPAQPARPSTPARPGPHRRPHRLGRSTGARPDHAAHRHRHRLRRRRRPRPRRAAGRAGPRAARRPAPRRAPRPRAGPPDGERPPPVAPALEPVVAFDPRWLRFAPFTGTGLVVIAAAARRRQPAARLLRRVGRPRRLREPAACRPWSLVVARRRSGCSWCCSWSRCSATWSPTAATASPAQAGAWHVRRGLLTTRETSIDEDRLAGVRSASRWPCGWPAGGTCRRSSPASTAARPAARCWCRRADADVAPRGRASAARHRRPGRRGAGRRTGRAAARRRWTRALLPAAGRSSASPSPPWRRRGPGGCWCRPLLAAPSRPRLAPDRAAGLGHALVDGHLVARSGSLVRRREVLGVDHVIGWNLRATWFQRRAGLTTLVATTAGGGGSVGLLDVPEAEAVRVADRRSPGWCRSSRQVGLETLGSASSSTTGITDVGRGRRAGACPETTRPQPEIGNRNVTPAPLGLRPCSPRCWWPTVARSRSGRSARPTRSGRARSRSSPTRTAGPSTG